jgi:hypothetical protein
MYQTKSGNNLRLGMKGHIGVDPEPGIVRTLQMVSANLHNLRAL